MLTLYEATLSEVSRS